MIEKMDESNIDDNQQIPTSAWQWRYHFEWQQQVHLSRENEHQRCIWGVRWHGTDSNYWMLSFCVFHLREQSSVSHRRNRREIRVRCVSPKTGQTLWTSSSSCSSLYKPWSSSLRCNRDSFRHWWPSDRLDCSLLSATVPNHSRHLDKWSRAISRRWIRRSLLEKDKLSVSVRSVSREETGRHNLPSSIYLWDSRVLYFHDRNHEQLYQEQNAETVSQSCSEKWR